MAIRKRILGVVVRIERLELPTSSDVSVVWRVSARGRVFYDTTRRLAIRGLFSQIVTDIEP